MPLQACEIDGKPGFQWGEGGACYAYAAGDERSRMAARKKALAQGIASGEIDIDKERKGVMVALMVPGEVAKQIAIPGGEAPEDLHCTLAYLGKLDNLPIDVIERVVEALEAVACAFAPVTGHVGGIGRFNASKNSDGKDVFYGSYNSPVLPALRQAVVEAIDKSGLEVKKDHGYSPHITLKYLEPGEDLPTQALPAQAFVAPTISVVAGGERRDIQLKGTRLAKAEDGEARIVKASDDERTITAVVLRPNMEDTQGDIVPPEDVRAAAHYYLEKARVLGLRHKDGIAGAVLESYIAPVDFDLGAGQVKAGDWVMVVRIDSEAVWADVKAGKLNAFSIGGYGTRQEVA